WFYLDHCAFQMFSENAKLGERLTSTLHSRDGTPAISWLNFGEYATVTDAMQRRLVEQFLNGILPRIFCIDVDPAVMDRERSNEPLPHADQVLAKLFYNNEVTSVGA